MKPFQIILVTIVTCLSSCISGSFISGKGLNSWNSPIIINTDEPTGGDYESNGDGVVKLIKITRTYAIPVPVPIPFTKEVPVPVPINRVIPYPVPVEVHKPPIVIRHPVPVAVPQHNQYLPEQHYNHQNHEHLRDYNHLGHDQDLPQHEG